MSKQMMKAPGMKKLQKEVMDEVMALQELPVVTPEELAKHNKPDDCWVMIDGIVYDVTKFAKLHPGGAGVLHHHGGTDATKDFKMVHHYTVLQKPIYHKLRVGRKGVEELPDKEVKKLMTEKILDKWIPFSEPYWVDPRGTLKSPYYQEKHLKFRQKVRDFMLTEIAPNVAKWDEAKKYPLELHEKAYKAGIYACAWPEKYGGTPPEGGWDMFMDFIKCYEDAYIGAGGLFASWLFTMSIALPPILNHGSEEMKQTVGREVITGKAIIALAVTEPWGGSDVANVRTRARREGDFFVVNGEKKFITSGMTAKYFTTCVRTDPKSTGMQGLSLLVIDANAPGVTKKKIETQGWWAGNTSYITFENVKVPAANLIGTEGKGFLYVMENFNHERFAACVGNAASCHMLIRESVKYARGRQTFGKPLIENQVIRQKIAQMAMRAECCFAWAEQLAYFMSTGCPHADIAPRIALCKVYGTQSLEYCAREASQILGGNSYQRGSGPGAAVERTYREVRVNAIGGGSEEVMMDFAIRASKL